MPTLCLPMREQAELFLALRMEPERQEALIQAPELGAEEEGALRGYLPLTACPDSSYRLRIPSSQGAGLHGLAIANSHYYPS